MKSFDWVNASSVAEAVKFLTPAQPVDNPDEAPRPIAGGQDLHTTLKDYLQRPPRVVNLKTIKGLSGIQIDLKDGAGSATIGATTTLTDIAEHPDIQKNFPALAQAAASVATPQIRNVGTIGGNLCQRPRCWYFRLEHVICRKKGGNTCYAIQGENKYNAIFNTGPSKIVHPSDLATALVALNATITVQGAGQPRQIPAAEFFVIPEVDVRRENILKDGEIITSVHVRRTDAKSTYLKFKERESLDFAISAVAAALTFNPDKSIKEARLVLGGVASIPWRVEEAEKLLLGKKITDDLLSAVAAKALEEAEPLEHNAYKVPLTQTLIKRALTTLNA